MSSQAAPRRAERSSRSSHAGRTEKAHRYLAVLVSGLLGAGLLVLAIPRTVAAWASLAAEPAIEKIQLGKTVSEAELEVGTAGLQRALAWTSSARRLTDLALLELVRAEGLGYLDHRRAKLLAEAEEHVTAGLMSNPANGFAWLRLAVIRELRGAHGREVASALAQSVDMAPNMRRLWIPRCGLILRYWGAFTEDELLSMRRQIRTIWSVPGERTALLAVAMSSGHDVMIGWALADDPEAFLEFMRIRRSSIR